MGNPQSAGFNDDEGPPRVVITKTYGWPNFNISFGWIEEPVTESPQSPAEPDTHEAKEMIDPFSVFRDVFSSFPFGTSNKEEAVAQEAGCNTSQMHDKNRRMEFLLQEHECGDLSDDELRELLRYNVN